MTSESPIVFIRHASVSYDHVILFENLNLTLPAGKWTCLLGPSGVGKTSLLKLIAGLKTDDKTLFHGEVNVNHKTLLTSDVAYLAQTDLLMPWLTAMENALLGMRLRGEHSQEKMIQAKNLFQQMGLTYAEEKYPHQLSGGMRQRVALIRTLLEEKLIVLMDEPFSALDAITRFQLQTVAAELLKNRTVLFITHDPVEALRLADEIFILSGQPALLHQPLTLTTATPRDPADPEFIAHQAELFHALIDAKAKT